MESYEMHASDYEYALILSNSNGTILLRHLLESTVVRLNSSDFYPITFIIHFTILNRGLEL